MDFPVNIQKAFITRAITSPFVMGYGLAVIASASLSSAVLPLRETQGKKINETERWSSADCY